jgi:prophage DNA circulation protein
MSWRDRVKGEIVLTSPDGQTFTAKWIGNERTADKQLGIFNYPKVDKQVVQDLGILGVSYPLTLYFDGPDNDLVSTRFFDAISASGEWLIDHPSKGRKFLQPVRFKEQVAPIESGTITVFATEWIEVALDAAVVSAEQLSALIETQNAAVEAAVLDQMVAIADQSSVENIETLKSATEKGLAAFDESMASVIDEDADVAARVAGIQRGIADTLDSSPLDLTVLGGQIQALVSAPAAVTGSVLASIRSYQSFVDKLVSIPISAATRTERNLVAILEVFGISCSASANLVAARSLPETRAIALSSLDAVSELFTGMTDAFDLYQQAYIDLLLEDQYFSQSESFVESSVMTAQTVGYLLSISFDLAIEKRFTLKEDRSPIEIAITEYGALGDNDEYVDLFIETNALKDTDILILPAGREVVVYV